MHGIQPCDFTCNVFGFWIQKSTEWLSKMSVMMICQILIVFGDFEPFGMIPQRARINYSVIQSDISFPHHSKKFQFLKISTNFILVYHVNVQSLKFDHVIKILKFDTFLPGLANPSSTWPPIISRISQNFKNHENFWINYFQWI